MSQFFYDLSLDKNIKYFLPTIYVSTASTEKGYVDKKASNDVLESLNIDLKNVPEHEKTLLKITNDLRPELVFKKFEKNQKSKKTLFDLLQDQKFGYLVQNYISTKIDSFLNIISEYNLPLSVNLSKDKDFYNSEVLVKQKELQINLHFEKNENGLRYTLFLQQDYKKFYPSDKEIIILLNEPGWILFDKQIFKIQDVNSNKIKPFLTKKSVDVPSRTLSTYFNTFLKDIIKKVEIEAIGFEVIQKKEIKNCKIVLEYQFFKNNYQFDLLFDYDGYVFKNSQQKKVHSVVENRIDSEVVVIKYIRNTNDEQNIIKTLQQHFGLKKTPSGFLDFPENGNSQTYDNIEFLIKNKSRFQDLGIHLADVVVNQKTIATQLYDTTTKTEATSDWFDVKINIHSAPFTFYFQDILQNIISKNPFFQLPNGEFFLIPNEWFSKYGALARFSKSVSNQLRLPKANFSILSDLLENENVFESNQKQITYQPSKMLRATLRPYQKEGVLWLLQHTNNQLGACLADDMGLGKTLQTLALLVAVQENLAQIQDDFPEDLFIQNTTRMDFLKTLIILPTSLIFNWYNETKKFTPHFRLLQYVGKDRKIWHKKLDRYDIIFTSYATATKDIDILKEHKFNYVILDESQQIKNKESLTFKALSKISAYNKISLSGTPIENSLADLYAQMQFINPEILGSYTFFVEHFKNPIEKHHNQVALTELKTIVNPFILRRTKAEVLDDLPEISEQIIFCDLEEEQQKWYEIEKSKARNELLQTEKSNNKIHVLNVLLRLRQLSNHPKMLDKSSEVPSGKFIEVISYLETLLLANQKVLVFSSFTEHLKIYEKWCQDNSISFCKITGQTKPINREIEVNKFQNDYTNNIFFISLKTGGVGLNLTKASYVLLLDPWWNPFAEQQAIGRAHRIGQENKVHVVRFISKTTIEEKIIVLQNSKKLLSDNILDFNDAPNDISQNLDFLL